ncbi:Flp pilus assembly protein CpaB [Arthrobacter sp. MPF02]|uniref:Flp pilus assembly protein CpaB n=1 Tax=Arthrobacter sp. MPF02 TaxID=3388492 RepID=UPI0039853E2C
MKSRLLGGIVAVVLALVGTLLLVSYVQAAEARAQQGLQPVEVLVARELIPQGADLEAVRSATKVASLPAASVPQGALKHLDGLDGKVTAADILPGEPLLEGRLANPDSLSGPGAVPIPEGMQEISVQLDGSRVVGGRINPGETAGIVALFESGAVKTTPEVASAQQIFHKVLITSVQRAAGSASATEGSAEQANTQLPEGQLIVTFALSEEDAVKLAFSAQFGSLWLTKEPSTATDAGPIVVTKPGLYR